MKRALLALMLSGLSAFADKVPLINSQNVTIPTTLGSGMSTFWVTPSSANLASAVTNETGTGALVFANSPSFTTPDIGNATATTINGLTISSSTGTLTIGNGKTVVFNNSFQFSGTDGNNYTFPSGSDTIVTLTATQTLSGKTLTAPKIADLGYVADANGNELIIFDTTTSAVNELTFANAATGGMPTFTASGSDTNISIRLTPKGTGSVQTNDGSTSLPAIRGSDSDSGVSFEPGGSKGIYFLVDGAVIAGYFGNGQVSLQGTEGHIVTGASRLGPSEPSVFRGGASTTGLYFDAANGYPGWAISGAQKLEATTTGIKVNNGPTIQAGTGSPESAVTAPVGSLWQRTDGGAGTSLYVKESGSGNTGWVAK